MSEEEFINRIINRISKDYGAVMANELKYIIIRKEKEINKQKEVLDKIKEYIKENACYDKDIKQCCRDLLIDKCDYILELLEEIE